ncbi:hypothetical protein [uncultured Meiothermus sp.]|uniref:hypothetical protein n=1 Tax=uncultured Meiothermus sp. TaxID=157471 RepID=UPI00262CB0A0|nr:hypothetical protein [uncultured Meiothermus sp.]
MRPPAAVSRAPKPSARAASTLERGDVIGMQGMRGAATAPHVDMEFWKGGNRLENMGDFLKFYMQDKEKPGASLPQSQQQTMRVVEHVGLDNIQVRGLDQARAQEVKKAAVEMVRAIVPNYKGT